MADRKPSQPPRSKGAERPAPKQPLAEPAAPPVVPVPEPAAAPRAIQRDQKRAWEKQKRQFTELERTLGQLTEEKSRLEAALASPDTYAHKDKFVAAEEAYRRVSEEFEGVNKRYEDAFEKMMTLEEEMGGQ